MVPDEQPLLVIAICTIGTQRGLATCIRSLAGQAQHPRYPFKIACVVVDNAPSQDTRDCVAECASQMPFAVHYITVPERGISHARNAAVTYAREHGAMYLAFLDDDEYALPLWLHHMAAAVSKTQAAIVTGPVHEYFAAVALVPAWLRCARPFIRPHYPTGTCRPVAYTGNIWIRHDVLEAITPAFDPHFAATGGEDEHFSRSARDRGFAIHWCDEALVGSCIPPSRGTLRWLMQRGLRAGSAWSAGVVMRKGWRGYGVIALYAAYRAVRALGQGVLGVALIDRTYGANALFYMAQTIGTVGAVFGFSRAEYGHKVTHAHPSM